MVNNNLNSSSHYARSIRSQSGELADEETARKVEEAVQNVTAFCPALQKVDEILKQENKQINESIAATLCKRVHTKDDWKLQKLFYQSFRARQNDPALFLEMLMKSVEMEDKSFFLSCKTKASITYAQDAQIMKAVAVGLTLFGDFDSAFSALQQLIRNGQATIDCMVTCIHYFPTEEAQRASSLYSMLRGANIKGPEIDQAFGRFLVKRETEKTIDFCELTLSAMQQNKASTARKNFYKAQQSGQINKHLWESMIDYEERITKDYSRAKKIFFDSPIHVRLVREPRGLLKLDVQEHSWGCAALMISSAIRDFKADPAYGKSFIVVVGDDLRIHEFLINSIRRNWSDVSVQLQPGCTDRFLITV